MGRSPPSGHFFRFYRGFPNTTGPARVSVLIAKLVGLSQGGHRHEAARVHHASRRRGGCVAARGTAQQPERMRRIGVLVGLAEDDPETKARLAAFRQGLERLGWSEGRNVRIDYRFAPPRQIAQALAKELVALQPDVIFAQFDAEHAALQRETRTIPIVFVDVSDPIGSGFIASLARPGGNITGSCCTRQASPASGWRCSRRSRRALHAPLSWPIPRQHL